MAKFLAVTSWGLVDTLYEEMQDLGFKRLKKEAQGVWLEGNWSDAYRANLTISTATRILLPVLDFPAYNPDELYNNILKHDFTKYITADQTFCIDATVRDSTKFRDQRFVALKIKDAICDQFREKHDRRPDVETKNPDLRIMVKVVKNQVSVSLDLSGGSLSFRGYRENSVEAPLREHLAAAILRMTGWERDVPIIDPMCGSGTFLIEAARWARDIVPGADRPGFGFQRLANFEKKNWDAIVDQALSNEKESPEFKFYGYDIQADAISAAKENAMEAGVDEDIIFKQQSFADLRPPCERGIMIFNPPYGERLSDVERLTPLFSDISSVLKTHFKGWSVWVLSGNEELSAAFRLKASKKIPVWNGNIECRLLNYEIR